MPCMETRSQCIRMNFPQQLRGILWAEFYPTNTLRCFHAFVTSRWLSRQRNVKHWPWQKGDLPDLKKRWLKDHFKCKLYPSDIIWHKETTTVTVPNACLQWQLHLCYYQRLSRQCQACHGSNSCLAMLGDIWHLLPFLFHTLLPAIWSAEIELALCQRMKDRELIEV